MSQSPVFPRAPGGWAQSPGSSPAYPSAGNSHRPLALLRELPKGVK